MTFFKSIYDLLPRKDEHGQETLQNVSKPLPWGDMLFLFLKSEANMKLLCCLYFIFAIIGGLSLTIYTSMLETRTYLIYYIILAFIDTFISQLVNHFSTDVSTTIMIGLRIKSFLILFMLKII